MLIQLSPTDDVLFGALDIRPGFTAWLVKFPAPGDEPRSAELEHAYFLMAREAGIRVPRTRILGATSRKPGFFASERFDRAGNTRIHMQTLGGLRDLPHGYPGLDYVQLLQTTRHLTRNEADVAEMFRRACFNVLAHNRDDHSRNFAFLMNERGEWSPSPAYDLTFSSGPGGDHTMLVDGEGATPSAVHLLSLAKRGAIKRPKAILDEVRHAVASFRTHADAAKVPSKLRDRTWSTIDPG